MFSEAQGVLLFRPGELHVGEVWLSWKLGPHRQRWPGHQGQDALADGLSPLIPLSNEAGLPFMSMLGVILSSKAQGDLGGMGGISGHLAKHGLTGFSNRCGERTEA